MKSKLYKVIATCAVAATPFTFAFGQTNARDLAGQQNTLTTTVPFLIITPDSRSGGMGDAGVAISPDANTMHWNPAKLAFMPHKMGFGLTYTPWLHALVPDISLSYLSFYDRIDNLSGFGLSLRYFSLGDITFTNDYGQEIRTHRPYEFSLDGGYARKLSEHFSIGIAGRFIYSNLAGQLTLASGGSTRPGYTFAGDIAGYYTKETKLKNGKTGTLSLGGNISNLGGKITYTTTADRDFIPANLRLGAAYELVVNEFNSFTFAADINKLLVPTPPVYKRDANGRMVLGPDGKPQIESGSDPNVPVVAGVFKSFADAPGGFREELHEYNPAIGIEYWYAKQVAGRMGYYYEHPTKGGRQYLTFGLGLRYNVIGLDFAYLVPTVKQTSIARSPLQNTLRFSLLFNLDKSKKS